MTEGAGPIALRYEWNAEAMAEGLAIHHRLQIRTPFRVLLWLLIALYVAVSVGGPLAVALIPTTPPGARAGAIAATAAFAVGWAWLFRAGRRKFFLKRAARKAFASMSRTSYPVEWTIDADQLANQTELTASTLLWPAYMKAVEAPYGFLLYQNAGFFNTLPAHGFASPEELRRFAELARAKVPKYVVLGECQFPGKPKPFAVDEV